MSKKTKEVEFDADVLPDLLALTGLSNEQLDKALSELHSAGFINLKRTPGQVLITLPDLDSRN
jgi:hypothetical protein